MADRLTHPDRPTDEQHRVPPPAPRGILPRARSTRVASHGGSLISFPALLAFGYPSKTANVTNTVALWPGYSRYWSATGRSWLQ